MLSLASGLAFCLILTSVLADSGGGYYSAPGGPYQGSGAPSGPDVSFTTPAPVYGPPGGGYPPSNGGYPPSNGGYPPSNGGYPPSNGGYPSSNGGYPPYNGYSGIGGYPPYGGGPYFGVGELKSQLYGIVEPAIVGIIGLCVFIFVKNLVLPYLSYYGRLEEDERALGRAGTDPVTINILKAVSRGVCLERIVCQMGVKARQYKLASSVVRAIEESKEPQRLATIFRDAATGRQDSCQSIMCKKPAAAVQLARKRKHNSANDIKR